MKCGLRIKQDFQVTSGHCIKGEYEHRIFGYYCTKWKTNAFQIAVKLTPLIQIPLSLQSHWQVI